MTQRRNRIAFLVACCFLLGLSGGAIAQSATQAELISSFRLQHGESKVKIDPTLNRIAHEQAAAMAVSDVLSHSVLGPFASRVASYGGSRTAENIAFGYDTFPKTLDQWIASRGHRDNLLMHDATRVGVASAKSAKSGRTYWAMVIADERPRQAKQAKQAKQGATRLTDEPDENCQIQLGSICIH
jgi:Cysteine-rich secretory protein family